ncbi:hypothetical protein [Magnetospirillum sp. SS-4]|uniref:hypothetical protein n=1 Tax=Magnetospirillum sp. SS-4 TaxID=2681465 RepID=UPI00137EDBE5|nr:hypothetical protein [Magnetospirillum sp. SS-4]CAA7617422.1 conserved hypothetical protein [Magnetospirillum sp. SS-4]
MNAHPRALGLLAQVTRGLLRHGEQRTVQHLGDRSTYVGLSDVGRAITCLRAAVASKLGRRISPDGDDITRWLRQGAERQIADALGRQLILQRGHWLEGGVESALRANGVNLISQLEIGTIENGVPIRAHLDFVLVGGGNRPAIRVLELKSTEHHPQTLYSGYETQLYGQIGLLAAHWNRPAFSLKNQHGISILDQMTFPQICHHLFGIALPDKVEIVDIEGWVLCLSMSEARPFGPYTPDATMLGLCCRTAETLWNTVQAVKAGTTSLDDVPICAGFHPLCDWCDHADGCPKFTADPVDDPVLDLALAEFARLKSDKAALEEEIEVRESRIRQFCGRASNGSGWLATRHFRFKTSRISGRKNIDPASLRAELTNRLGEGNADTLLARATTTGNDYERLFVSPIKS